MAEVATPLESFRCGSSLGKPFWFGKIATHKLEEASPYKNCVYPYLMTHVPFATNLAEGRVKHSSDKFAADFA